MHVSPIAATQAIRDSMLSARVEFKLQRSLETYVWSLPFQG